uniref:Uncharacterized protein n=1 Tax=Ascaris lumbricoides TaxID=6252 RepID=A0A0M3HQE0_ASCLU
MLNQLQTKVTSARMQQVLHILELFWTVGRRTTSPFHNKEKAGVAWNNNGGRHHTSAMVQTLTGEENSG